MIFIVLCGPLRHFVGSGSRGGRGRLRAGCAGGKLLRAQRYHEASETSAREAEKPPGSPNDDLISLSAGPILPGSGPGAICPHQVLRSRG